MNLSVLEKNRITYLWKVALPVGINDLQPLQVLQQEKLMTRETSNITQNKLLIIMLLIPCFSQGHLVL